MSIGSRQPNIFKKFTTTSANYDLLQDSKIKKAIETLTLESEFDIGVELDLLIKFDNTATIHVNDRDEPEDLMSGIYYTGLANIKKMVIAENGVSGTVVITAR